MVAGALLGHGGAQSGPVWGSGCANIRGVVRIHGGRRQRRRSGQTAPGIHVGAQLRANLNGQSLAQLGR